MITQVIRSLESKIIRVHIYNQQIKKIISTKMLKPIELFAFERLIQIFILL